MTMAKSVNTADSSCRICLGSPCCVRSEPKTRVSSSGGTRTAMATEVTFLGAGDVGPVHGPADGFPIARYTELVRPVLASVDLRFGNCERQYSLRGTRS